MQADSCADVDAHSCSDRHAHACADIDSYALADRHAHACADIDSYVLADRHAHACADVRVRACSACAISCPLWAHGHAFTSMHDDARGRPRRQSSGHK